MTFSIEVKEKILGTDDRRSFSGYFTGPFVFFHPQFPQLLSAFSVVSAGLSGFPLSPLTFPHVYLQFLVVLVGFF